MRSIGRIGERPSSSAVGIDRRPLRVVQMVTTLARGGAQATVLGSARMAHRGIDVTVVAGTEVWAEGSFWESGDLRGIEVVPIPALRRRLHPVHDPLAFGQVVRALRRLRPDVVHTHSTKAGVFGRLAAAVLGLPCLHTVHGWGPLHSTSSVAVAGATMLERGLARITDAMVVVGEDDLERGLTAGIGDRDRYHLIRSGIELDPRARPDRAAARAALGVGREFVIGMVGRMAGQKDQVGLVEAFATADLPDTVLVLVGDGVSRPEVEAAVVGHGIGRSVRFVGARPDAADLVVGFDVAALSSWYEGMPRTVVEAVAAGVPVVSSDVGSVGRLIEDGVSGRLVPIGDRTRMARALVDAHRDPERSLRMAARATGRVGEYSADGMRDRLARLWFEVAGRVPAASRHAEAAGFEQGLDGDPGAAARPADSRPERLGAVGGPATIAARSLRRGPAGRS